MVSFRYSPVLIALILAHPAFSDPTCVSSPPSSDGIVLNYCAENPSVIELGDDLNFTCTTNSYPRYSEYIHMYDLSAPMNLTLDGSPNLNRYAPSSSPGVANIAITPQNPIRAYQLPSSLSGATANLKCWVYLPGNNFKSPSGKLPIAFVDTKAPSKPSGLTLVSFSSSQISLRWTPSDDFHRFYAYTYGNDSVSSRKPRIKYEIYVNGVLAVTLVNTESTNHKYYNLLGTFSPKTNYKIKVRAIDVSGNISEFSNTVEAGLRTLPQTQK